MQQVFEILEHLHVLYATYKQIFGAKILIFFLSISVYKVLCVC